MTRPSDMDGEQDDFGAEDGTDAFLKNFLPNDADAEKKPSEKGKDDDSKPTPEADDEDEAAEKPAESDDEGEEETPQRKYAEDDDATYVKVKVGEEEHEVSVKDLKRLWGQESALTQKSQQVAEARKAVETEQQRYITGTAAMLDRAKARYEPYSKIDFLLAAKELSAEEYTSLRNEAQAAYDDVTFLHAEVDGLVKQISAKAQTDLVEQAKATIKTLSGDPKDGGIEGWSEKLYDDIRAYGVAQGIEQTAMNRLVDASALRLIHKAMLYDRGSSKVVTTKVNKTPKKVVKSSSSPTETKASKGGALSKANERLRREGTIDAAEDAFLAAWAD
jgi:hypothetical protein